MADKYISINTDGSKHLKDLSNVPISTFSNDIGYANGTGDMSKSVYDKDNTGSVDFCDYANSTSWGNILLKPSSSPTNIDDSVTKRHTHDNKTTIDKITEVDGQLLYNGISVQTGTAITKTSQIINDSSYVTSSQLSTKVDKLTNIVEDNILTMSSVGGLRDSGKTLTDFATSTQGTKADNALPSTSYTADDVLSKILTVDGAGSLLDSDKLDGKEGSYYAPINSPTFTGTPLAPTPSVSDSSSKIATTSYVQSQGFMSSVTIDSTTQKVNLKKDNILVGNRSNINFAEGSGITLTVTDNNTTNAVDIVVASTNGGGTVKTVNGIANDINGEVTLTKTNLGLSSVDNIQQMPLSYLDTTNTLGTSNSKVPSQNSVKVYVDGKVANKSLVTASTTNGNIKIDGIEKTVYTPNKATTTSLGVVQIGTGLSIDANGIISSTTSGGTVTSVTSANTDLTISNTTSTPMITINSGILANQLVRFNGSAKYPSNDGSLITGLTKSQIGLSDVSNDAQVKKIASAVDGNIVVFDGTTGDKIKDSGKTLTNIVQIAGDLTGTGTSPQLITTGVIAGSYTLSSITIDAKGRITSASSGSVIGATINDNAVLGITDKVFSANKTLVLTNELGGNIGDITSLQTTNKSSTVVAINELKDSIVTSNTASNISFDNATTGMSATNVQSAVDMLFSYAYNGKSAIANVIGSPSTVDETFSQLVGDIQSNKNILANVLTSRGLETATSETLSNMITKVSQISSSSQVTKTILNVTAPYTKIFTFTNPINIINLCESVIKYIQGATGVNEYTCEFNNADSTNFNIGNNVSFNGTMSLDKKVVNGSCINNGVIGVGTEWLSFDIDKTVFNTLDELIYIDNITTPTFEIHGTNKPAITLANGDINLTGIYNITKITWLSTTSNLGVSLLVMSFDSGATWYGFNGTIWNIIDISSLADIKAKGMNIEVVSSLTSSQLEIVRNNSVTLRFGYYLENGNYKDIANNDSINVVVEMIGSNIIAPSTDYTVALASDGSTLTYDFSTSGSYTLNIFDNLG